MRPRTLLALCSPLLVLLAAAGCKRQAPPPAEAPPAAVVLRVVGAATAEAAGGGASAGLVAEAKLANATRVSVGPGGWAALALPGVGEVELSPGARAVVGAGVEPLEGEVEVRAARSGPGVEVTTRAGVVRVEPGGEVTVEARAAGAALRVRRGKARAAGSELRGGEAWVLGPQGLAEAAPEPAPTAPAAEGKQAPRPARGLGTMTARVPGTEAVVGGVRLASHHAQVTLREGLARTEIEEVFENETGQVLEGKLVFAVPSGVMVERLSLWVGDKLVESEVVERKQAAKIFKGIVDDTVRPRDPALLEWVRGGALSLKIFPIPAHGSRKVRLAYDEVLTPEGSEVRYTAPLSLGDERATPIGDFSLRVSVEGEGEARAKLGHAPVEVTTKDGKREALVERKGFVPDGDLVVYAAAPPPGQALLHRPDKGESFALLRLVAPAAKAAQGPRSRVIVLDRSGSQSARGLADAAALALGLSRSMADDERFALLACDSACTSFPAEGLAAPDDEQLRQAAAWASALRPAGATDLAGALREGARRLEGAAGAQLVYLGDGTPSAGELSAQAIAARARPAIERARAEVRLFGAGRSLDGATLAAVASGLGASYEPLPEGDEPARLAALGAWLRAPLLREAALDLPPALAFAQPSPLPALRAGQALSLTARLLDPQPPASLALKGTLDGQPVSHPIALSWAPAAERPTVARAWASGRIASLEGAADKASVAEVVALSTRHHLLSRYTSLLVLENDAMFAAYGIPRTLPSGPSGTGRISQAEAARIAQMVTDLQGSLIGVLGAPSGASNALDNVPTGSLDQLAAPGAVDTRGSGGLKVMASGGGPALQGVGSGSSAQIAAPRATVSGSGSLVSGGITNVDRVLAGGRARVRACYQAALNANPDAEGAITFRIKVSPGGSVALVDVVPSGSLGSGVLACVKGALGRLSFDSEQGGLVQGRFTLKNIPSASSFSPGNPSYRPEPPAGPTAAHRPGDEAWRSAGEEALVKLRADLDREPTVRKRHEALLRALLTRGRFDEARKEAERFVELDPDLALARELLSYAAAAAGDADAALGAVAELVEADPLSERGQLRAARAYEAAGDERRACAHWRSLASLAPRTEHALYESLRCRARSLDDAEAALDDARKVRAADPKIEALVTLLEGHQAPPAYDPAAASAPQIEVTVSCAEGTERCPLPVLIAPNGALFSPLTPDASRSSPRSASARFLRDGTYRTLLTGGSANASGEVTLVAMGVTHKAHFSQGALQTVASTTVSTPPVYGGRGLW